MNVAVLVPVLRRPHRVEPLLESVHEVTPDARVLFICSPDDHAEQEAIDAAGGEKLVVDWTPCKGDYAKKVNAGVRATSEPLVFLGADDLRFHEGWFEAATARLAPGVGVVGTNDLGNGKVMRGIHSTHSLVTREYTLRGTVDQPDRLLHEGYQHNWVDNEFVETAIRRRAFVFAGDSIVEHLHPSWSKAEMDDVYRIGQSGFDVDRRLFKRRRPLWGN